MHKRHAEEGGWILVTAISLLAIMLVMALASMALVDTQQKRTREQRERESSLNLAEGVLYAQGFQLARKWPGTLATAVPGDCSSATLVTYCPTATQVQANADNVDTRALTSWTTAVRDNGGNLSKVFQTDYMNTAQTGTNAAGANYTCPAPCRWDANGDRKMWVAAYSLVRGQARNVVATLKLERIAESTPRSAVVAGGINTGNNGGQIKVWAEGSNITVRCNPSDDKCISDAGGLHPAATQGNPANLMTPMQLQRFKTRAQADGKYFDGCPPGNDIRGQVVWVENCNLSISASGFAADACNPALPPKPGGGGNGLQPDCINQINNGGLLIWHCGTMDLSGKATYIGLLYFVNNSDGTCPAGSVTPKGTNPPDCSAKNHGPNNVMETTGGFGVYGAVAIDGNACLVASANGMQVQYDSNVFNAVASYGTVGLVQDTWRELTPR
jgi:Tfp pilus assembly protein PilX